MVGSLIEPGSGWDCHVHVFDERRPVAPGHYRPVHRPLAAIERQAAELGIGHLVLVQPSVYGNDNGLMLEALRAAGGRHRGVAVVDASVGDAELDLMHAAGVRGIRFNLVSPAGLRSDPLLALQALAPRIAERGWHVQWYARAEQLSRLAEWRRHSPAPFVLDHLAGLHALLPDDDAAWAAAAELAAQGTWLKLSGWYRLGADSPYQALLPTIRRAASLFGARCVWGSDWPHTSFEPDGLPPYRSLLEPAIDALGAQASRAMLTTAACELYGSSA